ncbi:deleted in malignant brain tumors 1 protein-like [Carcharodon carcharias]|uniref:deleted in malignant brain tumors 1 protein-like n=1 Tax=Carcharodon carcharias TaxID=13397 RepID=UPI001B7DF3EA|nr:deleted in malignant brain tumors 1 protein-like [Carcharodon carcharias]
MLEGLPGICAQQLVNVQFPLHSPIIGTMLRSILTLIILQLLNCGRGRSQPHPSETVEIRLANGSRPCSGRVEIRYKGQWGTVDDNSWDVQDAAVVCRELSCGTALSAPGGAHFGEGSGYIVTWNVQCSGTEAALRECRSSQWGQYSYSHSYDASVNCSGLLQLRLSDGGSRCAGRVEIFHNDTWGSLCDDSWDSTDANVVCKQLDCGNALDVPLPDSSGPGAGPVWLDEINCSGKESHLWECWPDRNIQWGNHDCSHKEDVKVMCSEHKELRLVNGKHRCQGRLEVFYKGAWGTVCSEELRSNDAIVICKHLQCGSLQSIQYDAGLFGRGSVPILLSKIGCYSASLTLSQCRSDSERIKYCDHGEDAGVVCSEPEVTVQQSHRSKNFVRETDSEQRLRLVGGNNNCSGRVEVLRNNTWGTVCDDSWNIADANVVCGQLGCGSAVLAPAGAAFNEGKGVIWLNEVKCTGSESFLSDCASSPPTQIDCNHKEDASVICSGLDFLPRSSPPTLPGQEAKTTSIAVVVRITLGVLLICELMSLMAVIHKLSSRKGNVTFHADPADHIDQVTYEELENIPPCKESIHRGLAEQSSLTHADSDLPLPPIIGNCEDVLREQLTAPEDQLLLEGDCVPPIFRTPTSNC